MNDLVKSCNTPLLVFSPTTFYQITWLTMESLHGKGSSNEFHRPLLRSAVILKEAKLGEAKLRGDK